MSYTSINTESRYIDAILVRNMSHLSSCLGQCSAEPVKAFEETVSSGGASTLNVPDTSTQRVQAKLFSNLSSWHGLWKILLVGENEENSVGEFRLVEHTVEFFTGIFYTFTIVRVNDENKSLSVLIVVSPERTNFILTTNVPYGKADILVLDRFYVESCTK
jgi:hypothetical protein